MFRLPSLRSTFTTLAAAAVLVGGADLASYAATGQPLVLGHANSAGTTTSLKNTGRGPALSLNSARSSAPFTVNSSKLVKHLNADRLGGKSASQLAPKVMRFRIGSVGTSFAGNTAKLVTASVPQGTYEVSITGFLVDNAGGSDSYTCLVADKAMIVGALGGGSINYSKIYALDGDSAGTFKYGVLNYTNPAQKVPGAKLALGCTFSGTGPFNEVRQLEVTFRQVSVADQKNGPVIHVTRSAGHRLSRSLR